MTGGSEFECLGVNNLAGCTSTVEHATAAFPVVFNNPFPRHH